MIPPVSNSELWLFQRCRRHWYLKHVLWLAVPPAEEPPTGNRELGLRIHQAFEADAKSGLTEGPLFWVRQVYGAALIEYAWAADEVKKEQALAEVMVGGYEEWAAETGLDEDIEVVAAEHDLQVRLPGVPDVLLRGKLDRLIRRKSDGALLFRDWKTVGSLAAAASELERNPQMRFYTMLQRLANQDVRAEGGQVVYLLRSKRTARATPPFYGVEEVRYNRNTLNSHYLKVREIVNQMISARERVAAGAHQQSVMYPSPMASCAWDCPFTAMCPMMDSGDGWQDMAQGEYVQQDPYAYYDREITT